MARVPNTYRLTGGDGMVDVGYLVAEHMLDPSFGFFADTDNAEVGNCQSEGIHSGTQLIRARSSIGARGARTMGMERKCVPKQRPVEHADSRKQFVHRRGACLFCSVETDRRGGGEGHTGLPGTPPSCCFAHEHDVAGFCGTEVLV